MAKKEGHLANEEAQNRLRKAQRLRELQWREDLRRLMSGPDGRRFIWHLINDRCGVHASSYTGNEDTYYREGRRAVGIELMRDAQDLAPDLFMLSLKEELESRTDDALNKREAEDQPEETGNAD